MNKKRPSGFTELLEKYKVDHCISVIFMTKIPLIAFL